MVLKYASGKQTVNLYIKCPLWPQNLKFRTTGSPDKLEDFKKNILIYKNIINKLEVDLD